MIRTRRSRAVAALVAGALVIAACGGDDDSADEAATEDTAAEPADVATEEPADTTAEEPADTTAEEPADTTAEEPADTTAEEPADTGGDMEEAMTPQRGGVLTYLLEAESDTWDIPSANCASACITVMRQVMDPLFIVNDAEEVEPFLLDSYEVNDDFTEWTLHMRDGVMFQDGTPADGAALQRNLIEMAKGVLHGQVLWDLKNGSLYSDPTGDPADSIVLTDENTVTVSFSQPFATFGYVLAERTGWLFAPSFWDNPDRAGALPIGTGPFVMTDWVRGEETVLEANPNYWRTDPNGDPLPYLDGIVFRPVPDTAARKATMEAGDADINQDSDGETKAFWTGEWVDNGGHLVEQSPNRTTEFLLLNSGAPPFDNPDMRRALALCTDRNEFLQFRAPDSELANGPFAPGTLGYLDDTGFPEFDAAAGSALLDEIGRPDEVIYGTTNDPSNLLSAQLFADQWSNNCGLTVNIDQFDQSELITKALTGSFQVFGWRNHGASNPGLEYVWWHSRHTEGLALNFGRIRDPEIDSLLDQTRATVDPAELDSIAQGINQEFGKEVYNIWLYWADWMNPYQANVHNVGTLHLESGNLARPGFQGLTWLAETWKES